MAYQKFYDRHDREAPSLATLATLAEGTVESRKIGRGPISPSSGPVVTAETVDIVNNLGSEAPVVSATSKNAESTCTPAKVAKVAKVDDLEERAAIIEYDGNIPRSWAEGFAALSSMSCPHGFAPDRWRRIVDAAGLFIDQWAVHAAERGWTALDVFGCHNTRPDARFDCMGLVLLLDRNKVAAIDEKGADLLTTNGARQRFYRRPVPAGTVPLWDLVRADSVA